MENMEGDHSLRVLTPRKYILSKVWDVLVDHYKTGEPIVGRLLNPIKGGFIVGFGGFIAFLPSSHLLKGRSPTYDHFLKRVRPFIGTLLYFKILELSVSRRRLNFVVSRTAIISSEGTLKRPSE